MFIVRCYRLAIYSVLALVSLVAAPVSAKKTIGDAGTNLGTVAAKSGVEKAEVTTVAGTIIQAALGLTGLIFLILMVYAGFLWMTARGEEDQVAKAKKIITAAVLGLIVIIAAYAITSIITSRVSA